ncbi:MAG: hypothetical protein QOH77_1041, partial [Actinomycetota bacterium]|nr:hypothetical protein [Actinomycetota bacterium]
GLDPALHLEPERQPGEHSRSLATDVAGAHEEAMTRDLGIHWIFTKGANKELGEAC